MRRRCDIDGRSPVLRDVDLKVGRRRRSPRGARPEPTKRRSDDQKQGPGGERLADGIEII